MKEGGEMSDTANRTGQLVTIAFGDGFDIQATVTHEEAALILATDLDDNEWELQNFDGRWVAQNGATVQLVMEYRALHVIDTANGYLVQTPYGAPIAERLETLEAAKTWIDLWLM
jgi:hypothetical protein